MRPFSEKVTFTENCTYSTNCFLDTNFNGKSILSTCVHHSGATVIQISDETETPNRFKMPKILTTDFDFDSGQEITKSQTGYQEDKTDQNAV